MEPACERDQQAVGGVRKIVELADRHESKHRTPHL